MAAAGPRSTSMRSICASGGGPDRATLQLLRAVAHAVDEHGSVLVAGAAQVDRGDLARPAVAVDLHARHLHQQVGHARGAAAGNGLGVDHGHVGRDGAQGLLAARGGDDHGIELGGLCALRLLCLLYLCLGLAGQQRGRSQGGQRAQYGERRGRAKSGARGAREGEVCMDASQLRASDPAGTETTKTGCAACAAGRLLAGIQTGDALAKAFPGCTPSGTGLAGPVPCTRRFTHCCGAVHAGGFIWPPHVSRLTAAPGAAGTNGGDCTAGRSVPM